MPNPNYKGNNPRSDNYKGHGNNSQSQSNNSGQKVGVITLPKIRRSQMIWAGVCLAVFALPTLFIYNAASQENPDVVMCSWNGGLVGLDCWSGAIEIR